VVVSGRVAALLKISASVFALCAVVFIAAGFYIFYLSTTLPDFEEGPLMFEAAQTSMVYASDGSLIAQWHAGEDRTIVPMSAIAKTLQDAVVVTQDPGFFEHRGFDLDVILASAGIGGGRVDGAGSTITQQMVKMMFPDEERTLIRKVQETLLAHELSTRVEKERLLEGYLNTVYFGHGAYGIEAAAGRFFGVRASELTLHQSAMLAALIDSPGARSPINQPEVALRERNEVLEIMEQQGLISEVVRSEVASLDLGLAARKDAPDVAPYFVEHVKQMLIEELGSDPVFTGGLRVYTTLRPDLQREAEKAAARFLGRVGDPEYAIVAIESKTGEIVTMVGGRDFATNQFNLASQGRRQPGSAFKTFVLAEAIERGVRPDQVFDATPYTVRVPDGIWTVNNYENESTAPRVTLQAATDWSVNAVYARLIMNMGAESVVDMARRAGITSPLDANPAIALGGMEIGVSPLEMTSAYGTFANGGYRVAPVAITRVTDSEGNVVWEPTRVSERTIEERVARQVSAMLVGTVESGTGAAARIPGLSVAGKTGTTQSYRDAWFVGFTGNIVTGVWVGHREGQVDMTNVRGIQVSGGSFPTQIWGAFMTRTQALLRQSAPPPPAPQAPASETATPTPAESFVEVTICPESARIAGPTCPSPEKIYLDARVVPQAVCNLH